VWNSCDYDGGSKNGAAVLAGQALSYARYSGEFDYVCGYYHGGVWVDAGCGVLDGDIYSGFCV
jgi:hypothetical protein